MEVAKLIPEGADEVYASGSRAEGWLVVTTRHGQVWRCTAWSRRPLVLGGDWDSRTACGFSRAEAEMGAGYLASRVEAA